MPARKVDYLLIGGGLACGNCARWLREAGGDGDILVVGRESDPPYNRPECSKGYLRGEEERADTYFRPNEWWQEQRIDLLTRTTVTGLDLASRTAKLSTKEEVGFGQVLLATGANVRRLDAPGCELEGIHYLRSLANADTIRAGAADAEDVVLIGGSFIACEVAASLRAMGKSPTIVMQEDITLERAFGQKVGRFLQDSLEAAGVRIHGGEDLDRFEGSGRVEKVVTKQGLEVAGQLAVVGAGVTPDVQLARQAGLEIGERGGVRTSSRLRSAVDGVYAAGDICEYESVLHDGTIVRIEHWDVAFNQGKTAALNMLGKDVPHEEAPYFYSVLAEIGELEYVGPALGWDTEVLRGSFEDGSFTNWYLGDGRVKAALTWGRSDDLDHTRRLMASKAVLGEHELDLLGDPDSDLAAVGA